MGGEPRPAPTAPAGPAEQRLNSDSPTNNNTNNYTNSTANNNSNNNNNNNNVDPNNAAYLALRNHPETTIRPVESEMRSPENEESPRNMDENIFKQVNTSQQLLSGKVY